MAILKNRVYRLGIIFLALTLLTVGMVGNTLAKYVTRYTGDDAARVAQWGVKVNDQLSHELEENEFDLFSTVYDGNGDLSVVSNHDVIGKPEEDEDNDFVFAPGTKGEMNITVSGTPETAFEFHFSLGLTELGSWQDANEAYYNPIRFSLFVRDAGGDLISKDNLASYQDLTYEELNTALQNIENGALADEAVVNNDNVYAPNTNILADILKLNEGEEIYVGWEWPFESGNDEKDTFLGDIAAACIETGTGTITTAAGNTLDVVMPNIKLNVELGATQVDTFVPAP